MPEKIIIVEDSKDFLETAQEALERQGYDVTPFLYKWDSPKRLPEGRFHHAIIDALDDTWISVATALEDRCNDIIIYSRSQRYVEGAIECGYKGLNKGEVLPSDLPNYFS